MIYSSSNTLAVGESSSSLEVNVEIITNNSRAIARIGKTLSTALLELATSSLVELLLEFSTTLFWSSVVRGGWLKRASSLGYMDVVMTSTGFSPYRVWFA